jgi:hypothetical protein
MIAEDGEYGADTLVHSLQADGAVGQLRTSLTHGVVLALLSGKNKYLKAGSESGSVLDRDSIRSVDPDPYPDSGGQKLPKKEEKIKKFHVLKSWMFSFES